MSPPNSDFDLSPFTLANSFQLVAETLGKFYSSSRHQTYNALSAGLSTGYNLLQYRISARDGAEPTECYAPLPKQSVLEPLLPSPLPILKTNQTSELRQAYARALHTQSAHAFGMLGMQAALIQLNSMPITRALQTYKAGELPEPTRETILIQAQTQRIEASVAAAKSCASKYFIAITPLLLQRMDAESLQGARRSLDTLSGTVLNDAARSAGVGGTVAFLDQYRRRQAQ